MQEIAINGTPLHEVQMLTVPYQKGSISYLRYPTTRIAFTAEEDTIQLKVPPMLAIELYRTGILPQDAQAGVSVSISGKNVGMYLVADFRYPAVGSGSSETISILLSRADGA
ncbi:MULTISPECIES: hypothetical protein [unclassified Janthinobacterium]|uniref:hypothetical protein n=1 Tax=unclassified Janthinobacterium TaxID=2610881 RepID=UPI0018CA5B63|nr:hypothetical protein [Janthinobacterium sp. CG_23.4]MDH6160117.1 hypothetical protein [Janthinobacterium sp. CG_23.4]